ncbi:MAG: M20/M25/M40 family metallo-hydrolase [Chloroflexota bacterium]
MMDILPFLKSLLSVSGLSAHEGPVSAIIQEHWKPLVDELTVSRLGSLHGLKRGTFTSPKKRKAHRPSVLIAAHMDAIGLMVSRISDGFLHITEIGGIDPRVLPGTPVLVHASGSGEELSGVIAMPHADLLPAGEGSGAIGLNYLLVDTGLTPTEVSKRVRVGDLVAFNTEPVEMSGETMSGHSLDNRASVAALTVCLEELKSRSHIWDVWAVASTQEEVNLGGAATSAFETRPSLAVAVDVTFGKGPGANGWQTFAPGKGITLGIGPNIHPFLHKRFAEVTKKAEIPFSAEPMPRMSGTDAISMQVASEGIPTMVVGIPLRYMHTPVEVVSLKDIQRAGRVLAEFIVSLEEDFVEKIVWDE